MRQLFNLFAAACLSVMLVACTTNSFLPVHEYGVITEDGTTLGQRTVSDPHAFAPGTQRSWMEICQRKVVKQKNGTFKWTEVTYVQPCTFTNEQPGTNFVTFSPYVNGLATPLIQAGAIVGGAALLADGIRDSASRTTNNNANNNSATGGKGGHGGSGGAGGDGGNGFGFGGKGGDGGNTGGINLNTGSANGNATINQN